MAEYHVNKPPPSTEKLGASVSVLLSGPDYTALDHLARKRKVARAEVMRLALKEYLQKQDFR